IWKPAIRWASIIFIFMLFAQLNYFSFYWFGYETSSAVSTFVVQQIILMLVQSLLLGLLALITFVIAEAVTREAFPQQIQFWKVFDKDTATTKSVLGMVLSGYLMVPLFLAYVVGFYITSSTRWGWWYPSSTLSDPNILGSFFPWISAIGQALQAGFWEEAMFRALPLATMAIIGTKLKKRGLFITLGLIIQAFIFSGAHAGYAQQPYYFRLVELVIPSLAFAFLYLNVGLLPAVIMHFAYDAFLMNLSSFLTKAPGLALDRTIFIIVFFVPLIIVLWRKIQASRSETAVKSGSQNIFAMLFTGWKDVAESSLNRAFAKPDKPEEAAEPQKLAKSTEPEPVAPETASTTDPSPKPLYGLSRGKIIFYAIQIMLILLLAGTSFFRIWDSTTDKGRPISKRDLRPRLLHSMRDARKIADDALIQMRGEALPPQYKSYPSIYYSSQNERYHVLRKSGLAVYAGLLDRYIFNSGWEFVYKRFEGSLEERLEIYRVRLRKDGSLISVSKEISEDTGLDSYDEATAREIARNYLQQINPEILPTLKEVSAQPTKLPNRTDWLFTWQDESHPDLADAQARISVAIAGQQVSSLRYYVFIPEVHEREITSSLQKASTLVTSSYVLFTLFLLSAVVFGLIKWSKGELPVRMFFGVFIVLIIIGLGATFDSWHLLVGEFSTVEPYTNQIVVALIGITMKFIFLYGAVALIFAWGFGWLKTNEATFQRTNFFSHQLLTGLSVVFVALASFKLIPVMLSIPDMNPGLSLSPSISLWEQGLRNFLLKTGLLFYLWFIIDKATAKGSRRTILVPLICLVAGSILAITKGFSYATPDFAWKVAFEALAFASLIWVSVILRKAVPTSTLIHSLLLISSSTFILGMLSSAFPGAIISNLFSYVMIVIFVSRFTRTGKKSKVIS
ncbi:MAG: CPBP family intramembrane glutamic endopeptidase, partial [Candidatus Cloacimonadaceae bacterium]|nr:CPBP family intramembrane glutamic endopeptidase [Candidatus Cloacimonadaceae bacterium]